MVTTAGPACLATCDQDMGAPTSELVVDAGLAVPEGAAVSITLVVVVPRATTPPPRAPNSRARTAISSVRPTPIRCPVFMYLLSTSEVQYQYGNSILDAD